jgi:Family of unknown function (DUF5522)
VDPAHPRRGEILAAHAVALERGDAGYLDPLTGLFVLTARYLADRGTCCGNGCRHCPYLPSCDLLGDGERGGDQIAGDGGQADGTPAVPVGLGDHRVGQHHEHGAGGEGLGDQPVLRDVG